MSPSGLRDWVAPRRVSKDPAVCLQPGFPPSSPLYTCTILPKESTVQLFQKHVILVGVCFFGCKGQNANADWADQERKVYWLM